MTVSDQRVRLHHKGQDLWVPLRVWLRDFCDPTTLIPRHAMGGAGSEFYVRDVDDIDPHPTRAVQLGAASAGAILLYHSPNEGIILALPERIPVRWDVTFDAVREAVA